MEKIVKMINVYIENKNSQNSCQSFNGYAWSPKTQRKLIWKSKITDGSRNADTK